MDIYEKDKRITLELTEEQARAAQIGLDLFMRLSMGQFEQVTNIAQMGHINKRVGVTATPEAEQPSTDDIEDLANLMTRAKEIFGHSSGASFGIRNQFVCKQAQRAYEVERTINNALGMFDDDSIGEVLPMMSRILIDEPLPKAAVIEIDTDEAS